MKTINLHLKTVLYLMFFASIIGCDPSDKEKSGANADSTEVSSSANLAQIKAEIQTLENAWAVADNARDTDAVMAFYAEDAISMSNNSPMLSGKAAIRKEISKSLAKRPKGNVIMYDVMEVFGDENTITETGKSNVSDSTGNVIYTGKYMAIWQKRDGKYICIRDIYNDDKKSN